MLQTLYTCNVWPSIGRNVRLQTLDALLREVMFGSAINIRCIVAGSDGCGGSVQTSLLPSLLSRPLKPQLFCTIAQFARFAHFTHFALFAHFAHFMYFYKL